MKPSKLLQITSILTLMSTVSGCHQPCILLSNTTNILTVSASSYLTLNQHPVSIISKLNRSVAIDVHVNKKLIFWSDVTEKNIKRANVDGSNIITVVNDRAGVIDGLAVEWTTNMLYWTDTYFNRIEVARLDGSRRKVLIGDNLDEPRGISLDPQAGLMFWTDWGASPKIETAYLNGEKRHAIISSSLGWPNDIALDYSSQKIYWIDAKLDHIDYADYTGHNRGNLLLHPGIHPFGVDIYSSWLYWTDWGTQSGLHQMDRTVGTLVGRTQVQGRRMGLVIMDSSRQPSRSSDCQTNNGGCEFLCLLKPSGYACACPYDMVLGTDGKSCKIPASGCTQPCLYVSNTTHILSTSASLTHHPISVISNLSRAVAVDIHINNRMIFWSDVVEKNIKRANLDGSNIITVVQDRAGVIDGLAVEWSTNLLYWTDIISNTIEVARLDGSMRKILIKDKLDKPRGIALDPKAGLMFWTDWGSSPKIESAYLNGENRHTVISSSLGWPNSIAVDHSTQMIFWVDAKIDEMVTASYSGSNRKQLFSKPSIHPFGVAIYQNWLYWTDWKTVSGLHKMNRTSGELETKLHIYGTRMGLAINDISRQPSVSNPCQTNNGGCSHLCLLKPNGYTCQCSDGMILDSDGKTCRIKATNCTHFIAKPNTIAQSICKTHIGSNCSFSCRNGYSLLSGSTLVTCLSSGKWSSDGPTCVAIVCPALPTPSNAIKSNCHGQTNESVGTVCKFACLPGFQPFKAQLRTCLSNGTWDGTSLSCEQITCPSPSPLRFGSVEPKTCTTGLPVVYGTWCLFKCNISNGFMNPGPSHASCTANGSWSEDLSNIYCSDIQRPTLSCPADATLNTDVGRPYATYSWEVPVPQDNSGENLVAKVNDNITPPHMFAVGNTIVRYHTHDSSGLGASCQFKVKVYDKEPPKNIFCPKKIEISSAKKKNNAFFPKAVFIDNVGVDRIITNKKNGSEVTWGEYDIIYTAYDKAGNTRKCTTKVLVTRKSKCQRPPPPRHGGIACNNQIASMICTIHCNPGYIFAIRPPRFLMCIAANGKWDNNKPIPDCSVKKAPHSISIHAKLHYLIQDCNEQDANEIKSKFLKIIRSFFGEYSMKKYCKIGHCAYDNIYAKCDKKEDKKRKRTLDQSRKLTIDFEMTIPYPDNSTSDINNTLTEVQSSVMKTINQSAAVIDANGVKLTLAEAPKLNFVSLKCADGEVLNGINCAGCPPGYFYEASRKACSQCSVNHYQNEEGKTSCLACPSGTSTQKQIGSKQCLGALKSTTSSSKKILTTIVTPVLLAVVVIIAVVAFFLYRRHTNPRRNKPRSDSKVVFGRPRNESVLETENELYISTIKQNQNQNQGPTKNRVEETINPVYVSTFQPEEVCSTQQKENWASTAISSPIYETIKTAQAQDVYVDMNDMFRGSHNNGFESETQA